MTLSSAMTTAVSALKSQSQALSAISNNLANSSTTGYKSVTTSFKSMVTQAFSGTAYTGAGVTSSVRQNVDAQGNIESTSNVTDLALSGDGMFVVSDTSGTTYYTRNGEFDTDDDGYLYNNAGTKVYLMGWATDSTGKISGNGTSSELEKINVTNQVYSAKATSSLSLDASLGADTDVSTSATYEKTFEVYDSLGNTHVVTATFTHTAADTTANTNTWTVSFASDDGTTSSPGTLTMTFDGDGNLSTVKNSSSTTVDPATLSLKFDWNNAASDSSITLDLSSLDMTGATDGVTLTKVTNDGYETGKLSGISISSDGTVTASYSNGQTLPIYKIAVATFANYDGLEALSGTLYQQTSNSGIATLGTAEEGSAGSITASALESSTVDTADEFTRMIVAQQAYSAASQVVTTAKDMYETLISAVR